MIESLAAYIPMDRCQALARGHTLPDRTRGAALFADISGFTPLTEALVKELGPRRGADELTRQLNRVYDALITEVHRYRGSVSTFSGDAITCWLDGDGGLRAAACALAMQQAMGQFSQIKTPSGATVSLAMKAAVTTGPVRRFLIGAPDIQLIDVLAGATLDHMAEAEHHAQKKEVVLGPETVAHLSGAVNVTARRTDPDTGQTFAVVSRLTNPVEPNPWPALPANSLTEEEIRPWLLAPVYERLRSGQGQFLAELRPAVALFLRFGGLDYDDDDAAGQKLDAYIRWVQSVLARYESYLFQLTIGDKGSYLYAAFGAPLAHEDDAARAVAAAADLRSPPPEMDFISGVQIGLSQGRMRAGAYGGSMRRTYGVLGDEVNLAARLMGQAKAGQIWASKPIADAAAKSYHFKPLGRIKVKGKEDPLPVFLVQAKRLPSPQRPATTFTHPLVGREPELAQLAGVLAQVRGGVGQIVRIEAEAGLGKSHLAAEFAEQAIEQGFTIAVGTCQSTSQDIVYYPWRQAARAFFGLAEQPLAREAMPAWSAQQTAQVKALIKQANPGWLVRLPLLGDLLDLPIPDNPTTAAFDPQLRQEALFALAVEIITARAAIQPLFLLLEDVHWMDEVSRGLTLALARVVANAPILLALVHRPPVKAETSLLPELNRLPNHHHLNLGELSPAGVAALATSRLQGEPSPLTVSLIQAQSQGNPFFTEELIDALRETGSIYRRDDGRWFLSDAIFNALREANCLVKQNDEWQLAPNVSLSAVDLGIPDSIHGVVLSRLDRLSDAYKLTLKVASVIGRIFEFELLLKSYPLQPNRTALNEHVEILESYDFTRLEIPPPRLTHIFKHNVTQEVTYNTLLEDQQRELHRAVAEALEGLNPEAVEQLAYHYSRSGVRRKTMIYLEKAAQKAQQEYANETALNFYSQALALEERWTWRKGQIEVLHILGRRDAEETALKALQANPNTPPFEAAYLWGQYYEATGDYGQAQVAIEQAMATCWESDDVISKVRCLTHLGLIARRQGDYDRAKLWYNQALDLFQNGDPQSDREARALTQALNESGIVYRQQGQFEEANASYERALTLSRKTGNRRREAEALNSLGVTAFYQRDFDTAVTFYRQALDIRRAIGDRAGEGTTLYNLAAAVTEAGDFGPAEEYFSAALAIQQAIGNRWEEVNIWNGLGILYLFLGDLSGAQTCSQQGLRLAKEIGDEGGQAYILGNLGQVLRDKGDLAEAEKLLNDGLQLAEAQGDRYQVSYLLSHLAVVSLKAGKAEQAKTQARQALTMRHELDLRLWTTADLATLAAAHMAAGDPDRALNYTRQALDLLDECGGEGPEFPQYDYFVCHRVLQQTGRTTEARAALQSAYKQVMKRAEKITDPTLRQSFLEQAWMNRQILQAAGEVSPL